MASAKLHLSTSNSGVATTFEHGCHSHSNDQNPIMASLEYVGWIKEIMELDYGKFQTVVLLCNWVVANYEGTNAIVKNDDYRFTLVSFKLLIPFSAQSFTFCIHFE